MLEAKNRNGQRNAAPETFGENRQRYNTREIVADFFGVTEYEIRKAVKLASLIPPLADVLENDPRHLSLSCADMIADYDEVSQEAFVEMCRIEGYRLNKATLNHFADSSPDRWGRLRMTRRERILAQQEGRKPRKLLDSDFLMGVYDETRMGAIRFKLDKDGPFLSDDSEPPTPPWTSLRTLEEASRQFENDESGFEQKWINQLIKPGSSLGGARPKATVLDTKGNLWIAKFPSKHDDVNAGAWEKVTHDLARLCGLDVPESMLIDFSKYGSIFLVRRFDRNGAARVHFASAMTMLGKTDGASAADGSSYLKLVSFIKANGAAPKRDLRELWKRIVFNMAVSNTDDHMRNHGFIWVHPMPTSQQGRQCWAIHQLLLAATTPTASLPVIGVGRGRITSGI